MRSRQSMRIAISAMLVLAQYKALAQTPPPKVEEIIVTSSALRENLLDVAQPTNVLSGDELRRQIAASIGDTLSGELGVSSTYFGPSAGQPVIRGLGGYRVQVLQDGAAPPHTVDLGARQSLRAVSTLT
jgi:iron complex outermembrane recepter protein